MMSEPTILVIDDSATIRKLIDGELSRAGYRVVLAASGEEGLARAAEGAPDLVILDHQLPGTTGARVLEQLVRVPGCEHVPVVVSSTLRKKAYAEYADMPNAIDSLAKPFTPELLQSTVANALETGKMIVRSQSEGTAVPEVMRAARAPALAGSLAEFRVREVLDFLTCGLKAGALEIETERDRIWFYLRDGRIQAAVSPTVPPEEVAKTLPASLSSLAAVLQFTLGGGRESRIEGLVDLLDKRVLDHRLLRGLLRHQAAVLALRALTAKAKTFALEVEAEAPALFERLPLEISLAALAVEGALHVSDQELPAEPPGAVYSRRALRGQNLDRTGLSATHMKVVTALGEPRSADELAAEVGLPAGELRRVLYGLALVDWVRSEAKRAAHTVVALEPDESGAAVLRGIFDRDGAAQAGAGETERPAASRGAASPDRRGHVYSGRIVRDRLAVQLLLRRSAPDVLLLALDEAETREAARALRARRELAATKFVAVVSEEQRGEAKALQFDGLVCRPYRADTVLAELDRVLQPGEREPARAEGHAVSGNGAPHAAEPVGATEG